MRLKLSSSDFVELIDDALDYFWALSEILDAATEHIFILDWYVRPLVSFTFVSEYRCNQCRWLTPELYLCRPPAYYPEWRLDRLLLRKAQQGVKIYIVVYKEVTETMTMSSKHTKV